MDEDSKEKYHKYISQFKVIIIPINDKRIHYHFKKRNDMKNAMFANFNPFDTFSFACKKWGKDKPTKQMLLDWEDNEKATEIQ
jgi:hypothetical protein